MCRLVWLSTQPTGNFVGQLLCACSYDITYGTDKQVSTKVPNIIFPLWSLYLFIFHWQNTRFYNTLSLTEIRLMTQTHQIFISLRVSNSIWWSQDNARFITKIIFLLFLTVFIKPSLTYMSYFTLWDKSQRIWPIWKPVSVSFFNSHRIFRPSYNTSNMKK